MRGAERGTARDNQPGNGANEAGWGWGGGGTNALPANSATPLISRTFLEKVCLSCNGRDGALRVGNKLCSARFMENSGFAAAELGPKMQACNERERKFVWSYVLNGGNGSQAARDAGYSDVAEGCKVRAHYLLHRERVLAAVDEVGRKTFRGLLIPAITALRTLIDKPDHPDHAKAVQSTLSRLGLAERSGVDVTVSGEVTVNHTDEAIGQLRALKELGVPREKLEEIFGFSGLSRYEKMLGEADRKLLVAQGGPVIDGEVVVGG